MSNFSSLKAAIQQYIKTNGNEEITGAVLQDILLSMVSVLGDTAINDLETALQTETTNRTNADGTLQQNITAEGNVRQQADTALGGRIDGLQSAVHGISTMLGEGYLYAGLATTSTNPGTPTGKVFYIATAAGTYTNFLDSGSTALVVTQGINILKFNGTAWSQEQVWAVDAEPTAGSHNLVESGGVYNGIISETDNSVNNGVYFYDANLLPYVGSVVAADSIKIPLSIKIGSLVKFYFNSNDIEDLYLVYVKYKGDAERTRIFTNITHYVKVNKVYMFIADKDIEYFTFEIVDYTITNNTTLNFSFLLKDNYTTISSEEEYWNVYESKTDNILDVENVFEGISIDNTSFAITKTKFGVISKPIFVGDRNGQKITISGYSSQKNRAIYFFSEASLNQSSIIDNFNLTGTQRTVTIPNRSVYAILCLRNASLEQSSNDGVTTFSGIKAAFGENVATQDFDGKYLFNAIEFDKVVFSSLTENILDTSKVFTDLRLTDDPPYFVSNAYGIVTCDATYVYGIKKITIRTTSVSYAKKWVVFTTDKSRSQASVVKIVYLPVNHGTLQELTFSVPDTAVWMYVTLQTSGESAETAKKMTCASGDTATEEKFKKAVAGLLGYPLTTMVDKKNNNFVFDVEAAETWKRYLPYSVGAPVIANDKAPYSGMYQRAHLLFFTDNHIDLVTPEASMENVEKAISFVNDAKIEFDAVLNGGDAITPFDEVTKANAYSRLVSFFDICKKSESPFLFAKGNHDNNDWGNYPSNVIGDAEWSSAIYDHMETAYGFVRQTKSNGEKSSYGYYDISSKKIRVIIIDAQDIDRTAVDSNGHCKYYGGNAWHISDEQFRWIADTALSFNEDGWGVIPVIHQLFTQNDVWYTVENMPSSIQKLFNMFVAFNNHTTFSQEAYTYTPDSFYDLSAFTKDFSFVSLTDKPRVIFWLVGHEHFDKYMVKDGVNIIWTINGSANNNSSDQRVPKIIGTPTQNAFDIISIDTTLHKIWYVRYGAGENCYGVGGDRFLPEGLSY